MDGFVTRSEYGLADLDAARALCLYVATRLGDLVEDVVVVGGLVPSLLVGQPDAATGAEPHVGTKDVDLGLALRLLDGRRYTEFSRRLRAAGFSRDQNLAGNPTNQRWVLGDVPGVKLDFLIPPADEGHVGGSLHDLERDFAACVVPGLDLAFDDRRQIRLSGVTAMREADEGVRADIHGRVRQLLAMAR